MTQITTFYSIYAVCQVLCSNSTCFWWALSSYSVCSFWALKAPVSKITKEVKNQIVKTKLLPSWVCTNDFKKIFVDVLVIVLVTAVMVLVVAVIVTRSLKQTVPNWLYFPYIIDLKSSNYGYFAKLQLENFLTCSVLVRMTKKSLFHNWLKYRFDISKGSRLCAPLRYWGYGGVGPCTLLF